MSEGKFLKGFVLFHPPPKIFGRRRIFPDHETMEPCTDYGVKSSFDRLEKWAVKGMRRYPDRKYGFKNLSRDSYIVQFIKSPPLTPPAGD